MVRKEVISAYLESWLINRYSMVTCWTSLLCYTS
uniref:Uncharacterized protein n=1 Tax=Rhizophora mucronata TaxID=61149 RepID=A0A2P2N2X5_RHIMU